MKFFEQSPAYRHISKRVRRVTEPWSCGWKYKGTIYRLFVPVGYDWDGMSIHRVAWTITGLTPDTCPGASLPHDVFYRSCGGLLPGKLNGCVLQCRPNGHWIDAIVNRNHADVLLVDFMEAYETRRLQRRLVYFIVDRFGKPFWGGPPPKV
jgi:hypothetical protein